MSAPIFIMRSRFSGFGETEEEFNAAAKETAAEGSAATVAALQTQANVTYTPPPAPAYTPPPAQEPLRVDKPPTIIERIFGPSQPTTTRAEPRSRAPSMLDWSNEGFFAAMGSGSRKFSAAGVGVMPLVIGGVAVLGLVALIFAASQRSTR